MATQKNSRPLKVAAYCRVSTVEQQPEVQLDEIRAEAERRGWLLVHECIDHGISGKASSRPGLDALMVAAEKREVDAVVVVRLDRLGRSIRDLLNILDRLAKLNVAFVSIRDAGMDSTTATGRLMINVIASFAAFEADLLRERTMAGLARARKEGKRLGRPRRQLDLRAARILLGQGQSLRETASMLGVPRSTLSRRLHEVNQGGPETPPIESV